MKLVFFENPQKGRKKSKPYKKRAPKLKKVCTVCKKEKDATDFWKGKCIGRNGNTYEYLRSNCKSCYRKPVVPKINIIKEYSSETGILFFNQSQLDILEKFAIWVVCKKIPI